MSRIGFALIVSTIVLVCVATVSVTASPIVSARSAMYSFVLEASGKAYDRSGNARNVNLKLSGMGYGSPTWIMSLRVGSGTIKVAGYGTFCVVGGHGMLIQPSDYVHLNIRVTPLYGGPVSLWNIRGATGTYYNDEIPLTLSSRHVILPTSPHFTMLYRLELTGKVTLS